VSIADRLALSPELRDTSTWDQPQDDQIPEKDRAAYVNKRDAIVAYLSGASFREIFASFKLTKSEIYRMLDRCLTVRPDGRMFGFNSLVRGTTVTPYTRKQPLDPALSAQRRGLAGAFMQLVAEYPVLERYIDKHALKTPRRPARTVAKAIRAEFLKKCGKLRGPDQYPFNTSDQAARALTNYIERARERHLGHSHFEDESAFASNVPLTAQPSGANQLRPFEEIEHDGHNGDFYFVLKSRDHRGQWIYTTPMRLWLLLPVDRASRGILGYAYRFGSTNYPSTAVLRSFKHALIPWEPKVLTLPDLHYKEGAGFPSGVIPSARGQLFDLICFDRAGANIATAARRALTRLLGATVNYGRVSTPIARPLIERLNQTLETRGFRRLPIGFDPNGPKEERERAIREASKHAVTVDEIEEILDVMIAGANADPQAGLAGRSSMEFIRMWYASGMSITRTAADPVGLAGQLLRMEYLRTIKGGGKSHRKPYVELLHAVYRSDRLSMMRDWIGKKIRIVADIDSDLRFVRGFVRGIDGQEIDIGILKAGPPWHLTPHDLQIRQLVHREIKRGAMRIEGNRDVIQAFKRIKEREAKERRAAANELHKSGRILPPDALPPPRPTAQERIPASRWIKLK
jgi:putative transposase